MFHKFQKKKQVTEPAAPEPVFTEIKITQLPGNILLGFFKLLNGRRQASIFGEITFTRKVSAKILLQLLRLWNEPSSFLCKFSSVIF